LTDFNHPPPDFLLKWWQDEKISAPQAKIAFAR
jgi:hypothetical protein